MRALHHHPRRARRPHRRLQNRPHALKRRADRLGALCRAGHEGRAAAAVRFDQRRAAGLHADRKNRLLLARPHFYGKRKAGGRGDLLLQRLPRTADHQRLRQKRAQGRRDGAEHAQHPLGRHASGLYGHPRRPDDRRDGHEALQTQPAYPHHHRQPGRADERALSDGVRRPCADFARAERSGRALLVVDPRQRKGDPTSSTSCTSAASTCWTTTSRTSMSPDMPAARS